MSGALTTLVAHFSTIYSSGMAEIHARSAILNKQITKFLQYFSICILWIWNKIYYFFSIIIIFLRSGQLNAIHTKEKH